MKLGILIGSGDRIGKLTAPFLAVGVALNFWKPGWFSVGGPAPALKGVALAVLLPGVVIWAWSVWLILTRVPRHELITTGPFALMKHPLYTAVGLLVLPAVGLLLDSWLGLVLGAVVYLGTRRYGPLEEQSLAQTFGPAWSDYEHHVRLPWL